MANLRVLLCEPYFTGSHRAWAQGLAAHSAHDVRLVTHAGGFWKWRMQGAALTLARDIEALVVSWGRPDVLLTTDMVNVPALLGLAREALAGVGVVLYMHENQLTYPTRPGESADETYAMTNWMSMAAADLVVFNSEHHRGEVERALPRFLKRFPDHRHTGFVPDVVGRATVLPVGIESARFATAERDLHHQPPTVLWNHRWEYDKDPAAFFAALDSLAASGVEFEAIIAGERFQTVPEAFESARQRLGDRLLHFGTASDREYPDLLGRADVVVSTARHEFFGVAVLEAMAAGAVPVVPARLSYPDIVGAELAALLYGDGSDLVERLTTVLSADEERARWSQAAAARARTFDWNRVAPGYDEVLEAVALSPRRARP